MKFITVLLLTASVCLPAFAGDLSDVDIRNLKASARMYCQHIAKTSNEAWGWQDHTQCLGAAKAELRNVLPEFCNSDFTELKPNIRVRDLEAIVFLYFEMHTSINFLTDLCFQSPATEVLQVSVGQTDPQDLYFQKFIDKKVASGRTLGEAVEAWTAIESQAENRIEQLRNP